MVEKMEVLSVHVLLPLIALVLTCVAFIPKPYFNYGVHVAVLLLCINALVK